ncbi:MAG: (2Fe-2S)-binding protein [Desulfobacterales bacterium]|nr:(2Fe-2S)-binding protein [Desulfobacterales bacterium]
MVKKKSTLNQNLRISSVQRGPKITLMVNDIKIAAYEGESVHAALIAAGIRNFRTSKTGAPRGVFCGMGICYECLVTINNIPDQRACMTLVMNKMEIITEVHFFQNLTPEETNRGGNQ